MVSSNSIIKKIYGDKILYLMLVLAIAHVVVFRYIPMAGLVIAFKKYTVSSGLFGGPWVGLRYFMMFVGTPDFWKVFSNTLILNIYGLIFAFPAPIILALMLNEVKNNTFKRITQTVTYLPHFISTVIVVGMMMQVLSPSTGIVNAIIKSLGFEPIYFMIKPEWFRTLYITSDIWQGAGWGSILYLAALSGIDQNLYESSKIDGAGRWKQMWHITLPCIMPTIIILLLMRLGHILSVGFEKIILMQGNTTNSIISSTADVLATFIYRTGIQQMQFSYATAVGLFDAVLGLLILITANAISKRLYETSLW